MNRIKYLQENNLLSIYRKYEQYQDLDDNVILEIILKEKANMSIQYDILVKEISDILKLKFISRDMKKN